MMSHVYNLGGFLDALESGLYNGFGGAYESHDGAVCGGAGIDVEQGYAFNAFYGVGYEFYGFGVASFAEVGDALYDAFIHGSNFISAKIINSLRQCKCSLMMQ